MVSYAIYILYRFAGVLLDSDQERFTDLSNFCFVSSLCKLHHSGENHSVFGDAAPTTTWLDGLGV